MAADRIVRFQEAMRQRILVLDGAVGTMLMAYGLREEDYRGEEFAGHDRALAGNLDLLTLTRSELIETIHRSYLNAGADIITTNTFNANALMQQSYGTAGLVERLNIEACELAHRVADSFVAADQSTPLLIVGVMGPTNLAADTAPATLLPQCSRVPAADMLAAYTGQALALIRGGADVLMIETASCAANLVAACEGVVDACAKSGEAVPLWISGSPDRSGERLFTGESLESFVFAAMPYNPVCIGLNCGYGGQPMTPGLRRLAELVDLPLSAHPNAGMPDDGGLYPEDPEQAAMWAREVAEAGLVNVVGGCCGTTPEHIWEIARVLKESPPREF